MPIIYKIEESIPDEVRPKKNEIKEFEILSWDIVEQSANLLKDLNDELAHLKFEFDDDKKKFFERRVQLTEENMVNTILLLK